MPDKYCIDTSALSDGWVRYYRPSVHRTLWDDLLPSLMESGRLCAPMEVKLEIQALGGGLFAWACDCSAIFLEQSEQIQKNVRRILERFPDFLPAQTKKEWADPWVIATAMELGHCVVTGEKLAGKGQDERPRIPDVCSEFDVKCLHTDNEPTPGLHFMMEQEGWTF